MASAVLGKVSPTPKGEYVSTQDYDRLDVVTYEGYPYLAKSNVPSGNLPTDELYWMPLLTGLDFAPGGYGLGAYGIYCSDCNSATKNGWYRFDANTLNIAPTASQGSLFVRTAESSSGVIVYQTMWNGYWRAHRFYGPWDNTWTEWEFENPPMTIGVEYSTTERWNGKVVYTKLVDLGTLPDSATSEKDIVFFAGSMAELVSVDVSTHAGSTWRTEDTRWSKYVYKDSAGAHIVIKATENVSGYSGFAVFKYTKN